MPQRKWLDKCEVWGNFVLEQFQNISETFISSSNALKAHLITHNLNLG